MHQYKYMFGKLFKKKTKAVKIGLDTHCKLSSINIRKINNGFILNNNFFVKQEKDLIDLVSKDIAEFMDFKEKKQDPKS